jgi:hypothetical protein
MTDLIQRPLSADVAEFSMPEEQIVLNGLRSLGQDAATVRATLAELGMLQVEGRTRSTGCPIAQFVRAQVGRERNVSTVHTDTLVDSGLPTQFQVYHPQPVVDFIQEYDDEQFAGRHGV